MVKKFKFKYAISSLRVSHSASDNGWSACIYNGETKEFYHSREYRISVHSFLRKFRSHETVTPCFFAAFKAASVKSAALSDTAGVMPVKWNQSQSLKIASKSKSFSVAVQVCNFFVARKPLRV